MSKMVFDTCIATGIGATLHTSSLHAVQTNIFAPITASSVCLSLRRAVPVNWTETTNVPVEFILFA
jgi:hypothetical protein